jgi:membrane associated rhomboid family serine protease
MRLRVPPATLAIVALTGVVSLAISLLHRNDAAMFAMGFIPQRLSVPTPRGFGMVPVLLTPLSATLVHSGYSHLIGNLCVLLVAGSFTERSLGWRQMLILYVVSAYAAACAQWVVEPNNLNPMIGASGAIAGCIGALIVLRAPIRFRGLGFLTSRAVQVLWYICAWTVAIVAVAMVARSEGYPSAWGAHVGGFIAGSLMARPLRFIRLRTRQLQRSQASEA